MVIQNAKFPSEQTPGHAKQLSQYEHKLMLSHWANPKTDENESA